MRANVTPNLVCALSAQFPGTSHYTGTPVMETQTSIGSEAVRYKSVNKILKEW